MIALPPDNFCLQVQDLWKLHLAIQLVPDGEPSRQCLFDSSLDSSHCSQTGGAHIHLLYVEHETLPWQRA